MNMHFCAAFKFAHKKTVYLIRYFTAALVDSRDFQR